MDRFPGLTFPTTLHTIFFISVFFKVLRPALNGEPFFANGWLDQSWWPDGLYTAPTEEALVFDLKAIQFFGFNAVRLHQKVNSER